MHLIMRRLHPRGAANRGICVDAEGAMLGPDCVLVRRTSRGFRGIERYLPKIFSYLDRPQTLTDLQNAAARPAPPGYEIHHIVEAQYRNRSPNGNSQRFGKARLESRENLVRVPYWKHVEISSWYSTTNKEFGGLTPRAYLRGRSWAEQYKKGLDVLRDFGVLR